MAHGRPNAKSLVFHANLGHATFTIGPSSECKFLTNTSTNSNAAKNTASRTAANASSNRDGSYFGISGRMLC
jgi:hypothetical protein